MISALLDTVFLKKRCVNEIPENSEKYNRRKSWNLTF